MRNTPLLTPDIPLGPFEDHPITVYLSGSTVVRVHAKPWCPSMRTQHPKEISVLLNAETISRMCARCAKSGPWGRSTSAVGVFLASLTGTGLLHELSCHPGEEGLDDPPLGTASVDELFSYWRDSSDSLHEVLRTVGRYPWLSGWAVAGIDRKAQFNTSIQHRLIELLDPDHLITSAAAFLMEQPTLSADPKLSVFGDAAEVRSVLAETWRSWYAEVSNGPQWLVNPQPLAHPIVCARLGSRRGRTGRRMGAKRMLTSIMNEWCAQAQRIANGSSTERTRWIIASVPQSRKNGHRYDKDQTFNKMLTPWQLRAIALHSVKVDWKHRVLLLRVPNLVAERLLEETSKLRCTEIDSSSAPDTVLSTWLKEHHPPEKALLPGVLDDTPVHARRIIRASDIRALQEAHEQPTQPYFVFSTTHGVEVLLPGALIARCEDGWEGVLLAGASDLPSGLTVPLSERLAEDIDEGHDSSLLRRDKMPSEGPGFADHLSERAGELSLQKFADLEESDFSTNEAAAVLIAARSVHDLRTLGGKKEWDALNPNKVWYALLAFAQLDLTPFKSSVDTFAGRRVGLDLPLAHLADVQLYTTNADPLVKGKGHAPFCQHAPMSRSHLDSSYDLISVRDLQELDHYWCSVCSGYSVRRLDKGQVSYYTSAHQLNALWEEANHGFANPDSNSRAEIEMLLSNINDLSKQENDPRMNGPSSRRWEQALHETRLRAEQLLRHTFDPRPMPKSRQNPRSSSRKGEFFERVKNPDTRIDLVLRDYLRTLLQKSASPSVRMLLSAALEHIGRHSSVHPKDGKPVIALLEQARSEAAQRDEWDVVRLLQDCMDYAIGSITQPDFKDRLRLFNEGKRDHDLRNQVARAATAEPGVVLEKIKKYVNGNPDTKVTDLIYYLENDLLDIWLMDNPLDRPGRYRIVRGRAEFSRWVYRVLHERLDVENPEEAFQTMTRLVTSPAALRLLVDDPEGQLLLRATELHHRQKSLSRLRALVERPDTTENQLQKALEGQYWIFGGEYVGEAAHRRLVPGDEVDIPLIRGDGSLHIVELKRARSLAHNLVKKHRGVYVPTAEVNDAVAQAANYLVGLDENRSEIRNRFSLETRRASAVVLVGHPLLQPSVPEEQINEALRKLNSMVSRVEVLTYKELIDNAERALGYHDPS
jgi:hypothetical protein